MTAKYIYRQLIGQELLGFTVPVEILAIDKKTYKVKILSFCRGYSPGKVIRVRKRNIQF